MKRSNLKRDEIKKDFKRINDHCQDLYVMRRSVKPFENRDFFNRQVWSRVSSNQYVMAAEPIETDDHPLLPGVVRGRFPLAMKFRGKGELTVIE
jgi:hypothetical protein